MINHRPSPDLERLYFALTGEWWPDIDVARLRQEAARLYALNGQMNQMADVVADAVNFVENRFEGESADAFGRKMRGFLRGEASLEKAGSGAEKLADFTMTVAQMAEYVMLMILLQIIELAIEIAIAIAMAPWTGGLSMAGLAAKYAAARLFIRQLFMYFGKVIAFHAGLEAGIEVALSGLAQFIQNMWGTRVGTDQDLLRRSALSGGLSGMFGGVFGDLVNRAIVSVRRNDAVGPPPPNMGSIPPPAAVKDGLPVPVRDGPLGPVKKDGPNPGLVGAEFVSHVGVQTGSEVLAEGLSNQHFDGDFEVDGGMAGGVATSVTVEAGLHGVIVPPAGAAFTDLVNKSKTPAPPGSTALPGGAAPVNPPPGQDSPQPWPQREAPPQAGGPAEGPQEQVLTPTDLWHTDLSDTDLSDTDLSDTGRWDTDLSDTDLSDTDLSDTDLLDVKLREVDSGPGPGLPANPLNTSLNGPQDLPGRESGSGLDRPSAMPGTPNSLPPVTQPAAGDLRPQAQETAAPRGQDEGPRWLPANPLNTSLNGPQDLPGRESGSGLDRPSAMPGTPNSLPPVTQPAAGDLRPQAQETAAPRGQDEGPRSPEANSKPRDGDSPRDLPGTEQGRPEPGSQPLPAGSVAPQTSAPPSTQQVTPPPAAPAPQTAASPSPQTSAVPSQPPVADGAKTGKPPLPGNDSGPSAPGGDRSQAPTSTPRTEIESVLTGGAPSPVPTSAPSTLPDTTAGPVGDLISVALNPPPTAPVDSPVVTTGQALELVDVPISNQDGDVEVWLGLPDWQASQQYLVEHRAALLDDVSYHGLAGRADGPTSVHQALLDLARTGPDHVKQGYQYLMTSDPDQSRAVLMSLLPKVGSLSVLGPLVAGRPTPARADQAILAAADIVLNGGSLAGAIKEVNPVRHELTPTERFDWIGGLIELKAQHPDRSDVLDKLARDVARCP